MQKMDIQKGRTMKINTDSDLDLRYKKLRNSVFALIFWNIIVIDIALIYKAFTI